MESSGSSLRLLEALEGFWKLLECFLECSKVALLDCSLGWLSRVALLEWSCGMLSRTALLDWFLGLLWFCFSFLFGVSRWGHSCYSIKASLYFTEASLVFCENFLVFHQGSLVFHQSVMIFYQSFVIFPLKLLGM